MTMEEKITKAVIPAAGLGTRFYPITKYIPKEMLPIVNKPVIHYVVEEAIESGIRDLAIIVSNKKHILEDYLEIFSDVNISYIRQTAPLGLGDAIYRAKSFVGNDPFAILLGDEIIRNPIPVTKQLIDTYNIWRSPLVAMEIVKPELISRYGVIDCTKINESIYLMNSIIEKPSINAAPSNLVTIGRYIMPPILLELVQKIKPGHNNEIQLTDAINILLKKKATYSYLIKGDRYDCGSINGYLSAINNLSRIPNP